MDFGILLQAICYVASIVAATGILVGWVMFCVHMIKNPILHGVIIPLPVVVVFIILVYHMIAGL